MNELRARFVHLTGGREGAIDRIDEARVQVGRDASQCAVHAHPEADPSISRVHASVWFDGQRWHVQDAHSANGIRVNGQRVDHALLDHGSTVELSASVALRFELRWEDDLSSNQSPSELDDATAAFAAATRPSPTLGRSVQLAPDPTVYGPSPDEEDVSALPQADAPKRPRRRKRKQTRSGGTAPRAGVQTQLKMYKMLAAFLGLLVLAIGGSSLLREYQLKESRLAIIERNRQAAAAAGQQLFSEAADAEWKTRTVEHTEVNDEGEEVVVTEEVKYLPEDVIKTRFSAVEALLDAAAEESRFEEESGEDIFARNLSKDPFEAHIQRLMGELTGTPTNVRVPTNFLDLVKKKVGQKLSSSHKGRWSARDAYCRLQGIRPELEGMLTTEVRALRAKQGQQTSARQSRIIKDLIFVAWVESQYIPTQCSPASARGMWQFIPSTGRRFGMRVEEGLDQRCDWRRATRAAAGYFDFLLNEFQGYPFLALAAYNAGERRVGRVLKNPKVPKRLRNFYGFTAAGVLPDETRNYVPSIVASAFVGDDYDRALAAWNTSFPSSPRKRWAPCTAEESQPAPATACFDGPRACKDKSTGRNLHLK